MNGKRNGRASSIPAGLVYGTGISVGITLIMSAAFGKLMDCEKLTWEQTGYGVLCMLLVSSFTGAVISCKRIRRQKLLVCGMSGISYFAVLICVTALFFGGQYEAVGVTAGLIAAGCAVAALWEAPRSRGGKGRNKKYSYR